MRLFLTATLLAGVWAAPAFAQNDVASPDATFTGPRVELLVGYDRLGGNGGIDGVAYGGGAGFDFGVGGVVAGIEGEFVESGIGQDDVFADQDVDFGGSFDVGRDLYVGGRIGFRASPRTLIYGKGGYTNAKLNFDVDAGLADTIDVDATVDGYRLGAGVEQVLNGDAIGNAFVNVEYRYSNYSGFSFDDDAFDEEDLGTDIDIDRHQLMAGVGIRF